METLHNFTNLENPRLTAEIAARHSDNAVWLWDTDGGSIWFSENFEKFGYPSNTYPYDWFYQKIHVDDVQRVKAELSTVLETGRKFWGSEYNFLCGNNRYRKVFSKATLLNDSAGKTFLLASMHEAANIRFKTVEPECGDSNEHLSNLIAHLQTNRETETARITTELQQNFSQVVSAIYMGLCWLMPKLADDEDQKNSLRKHVRSLMETANNLNYNIGTLTSSLKPPALEYLGLYDAIEWSLQSFKEATFCDFTFESNLKNIKLANVLERTIFRIFEEALQNAHRHAKATHLYVDLLIDDFQNLVLAIRDNGKGIPVSAIYDPRSIGITAMRQRALQFHGKIFIKPLSGRGTEVLLKIPPGNWKNTLSAINGDSVERLFG
ncbi:MAG TPA: ATP-binding protein [Gammaproteobacteria bacterium]